MKTLLWLSLSLVFSQVSPALADNYSSPILCKLSESYLLVENTSEEPQSLWFQDLGSSPFMEKHYEIAPEATRILALEKDFAEGTSAFAIKTHNKALKFTALCHNTKQNWRVDKSHSPWKSLKIPAGLKTLRLHLVNLAQTQNPVQIQLNHSSGLSLNLPEEFSKTSLEIAIPAGATQLQIRAEGRWGGKAFSESNQELELEEEIKIIEKVPTTRYFQFRASGSNESFVVPLDDAKLINQSLEQIANPDKARLFVARIGKSLSGTNRDLLSPQKAPWSWEVLEAQNYADFAHISCDGSPSVVEERLKDWIQNTGGTICFWNYRVVREVPLTEIRQSPGLSPLAPGSLPRKH